MTADGTAATKRGPRLLFIDNIRIILICLVIATHCSITYGGPGSWYFVDPTNAPGIPFVLAVIGSFNQSFFMGFFVLVSAYFVPGSVWRKGRAKYAHDRLIRLGIPLLVWIIFIAPLIQLILAAGAGNFPDSILGFWVGHFIPFQGLQLGPMWFVFYLLIATAAYLLWTGYRPKEESENVKPFPAFITIAAFGIMVGIVTAIVRIFMPIGTMWFFDFQPPFFPQYIALFIVGIWAAKNHWLDNIPDRVGKACTIATLLLFAIQPFFIHAVLASPEGLPLITGGPQWTAICYALWEQTFCMMIITAMLWIFSHWLNSQGEVTKAMAGDSYTVYIIHPVVLISISMAFVSIALPQLAKFAVVLALTIAAAFTLAHIIRAVPGVKRVL